ncbi:hypothetical protein [Paracoccus sp. S-4012]|uniref:hypothetical protein n=1 Tax=Paracoccus sp. S-4012 TaxID=2665648 RepID=UPI001E423EF6|nr:hypothetical protein [Paracoccus sp. S-4012]
MLISFSQHTGAGEGAEAGRALTDYMDAPGVVKSSPAAARLLVARDPVPEILLGRADLLRASIRSLAFVHRYSSAVMSFARDDIDIVAFNAGAPELRWQVDVALRLLFMVAFAGIPEHRRPPAYVTTHTHTGRLEVNLAVSRGLLMPRGALRSINPHPPRRGSAELWATLQDALNYRFNWADTGDPSRARQLILPDWELKHAAEAARAGRPPQPDIRHVFHERVQRMIGDTAIGSREALLEILAEKRTELGFSVVRTSRRAITVAPPGVGPEHHVRLEGPLYGATPGPAFFEPGARGIDRLRAEGVGKALDEAGVELRDLVWIHESYSVKALRDGDIPVLRGTFVELDGNGLLYTNGSIPYYGTYPGLYVPNPLWLCPHPQSESTIERIASEVFSLTKVNWNSTQMNHRLPIPIRAARKVGDVLKYLPPGQKVSSDYRKYT